MRRGRSRLLDALDGRVLPAGKALVRLRCRRDHPLLLCLLGAAALDDAALRVMTCAPERAAALLEIGLDAKAGVIDDADRLLGRITQVIRAGDRLRF